VDINAIDFEILTTIFPKISSFVNESKTYNFSFSEKCDIIMSKKVRRMRTMF
jgi:hypothetical protein